MIRFPTISPFVPGPPACKPHILLVSTGFSISISDDLYHGFLKLYMSVRWPCGCQSSPKQEEAMRKRRVTRIAVGSAAGDAVWPVIFGALPSVPVSPHWPPWFVTILLFQRSVNIEVRWKRSLAVLSKRGVNNSTKRRLFRKT